MGGFPELAHHHGGGSSSDGGGGGGGGGVEEEWGKRNCFGGWRGRGVIFCTA